MTSYSRDKRPGRLLPLPKRLRRVTQDLANTSVAEIAPELEGSNSNVDERLEKEVSWAIRAWRERSLYIPGELLSDPAWGMLLNLFSAEIRHEQWTLSRLAKASGISTAAARRWVTAFEIGELATRAPNPHDSGNDFICLTQKGGLALGRYFKKFGRDS